MPAEKHPAYKEEKDRIEYTIDYANKELQRMIGEAEKVRGEMTVSKRAQADDSSQGYIDFMLNSMFQETIKVKLKNLEKALDKPYFARVDFTENISEKLDKIYIGKMSLMREEDSELIIVDWRAPVANLYYEERLGEAGYNCPDGRIKGNLTLKRQFFIDKGKLNDIFDIDITTNDEFLQTFLGANADNRLKDIVSTIQAEQNHVIRADMWKPLIVQGAAGSGKTTIALHRIAYLIYLYEKSFTPDNFMIIAPNRLFLNYISEVLPDLGVEMVKQSTFEEFAIELIGQKIKLKDPGEKIVKIVNDDNKDDDEFFDDITTISKFKSSIEFKEGIDRFIEEVQASFIPVEDFKIANLKLFTYEEINKLFIVDYRYLPLAKRIDEIKKHLSGRLTTRRDEILASIQNLCDRKLKRYKATMEDSEERHKLIVNAIDEKNEFMSKLNIISKNAVKEYISKISNIDPVEYYRRLICDENTFMRCFEGIGDRETLDKVRRYTENMLGGKYIEIEDIAPIIYLKFKINGINEKIRVKHIVIDEAQDFSMFQFYVLKKIVKDSSFTILGDLCQGIHSYRGIRRWEEVQDKVFEGSPIELLTLHQSYRNTVEIMEAANEVIGRTEEGRLYKGVPVIRHGKAVENISFSDKKEKYRIIHEKILDYIESDCRTIAIICKTMGECKEVASHVKINNEKIRIINGEDKLYLGGIMIVPSYLSKGLEFDGVIISDASSESYGESDIDIKLLYVSMTRALHRLTLLHSENTNV